jgi:hypothetical protein
MAVMLNQILGNDTFHSHTLRHAVTLRKC